MMQIPGLRNAFAAETVECLQVLDPALGPLVPAASARPGTYAYPGQQATVLVLGDSFCRIYQYPEPQSLGEMPAGAVTGRAGESGAKRLLPGSAGFISHLALALKSPVDAIVSDGGAATDVRRKLSTDPEILEGKRVVVWEFVERDIALGAQGWKKCTAPGPLSRGIPRWSEGDGPRAVRDLRSRSAELTERLSDGERFRKERLRWSAMVSARLVVVSSSSVMPRSSCLSWVGPVPPSRPLAVIAELGELRVASTASCAAGARDVRRVG